MLPVVVLKAEEILYSKANSEAEYMDFSTLKNRLLDAINTIIRLDESSETGDFLQPCIEAALNLAAHPEKLHEANETMCLPTISVLGIRRLPACLRLPCLAKHENNGSRNSGFGLKSFLPAHNFTSEKFSALSSPHGLIENALPPTKFSVYPLYYGNGVQWQGQRSHFSIAPRPVATCLDSTNGGMENIRTSGTMLANGIAQSEVISSLASPCDLALRLGPLSDSSSSCKNKIPLRVFKVGGSSSSREETKTEDCSQVMERKLPLFPRRNAYGLSEHNTWGNSIEDEFVYAETRMRKRKADFSDSLKERHLSLLPKGPSSRFVD
ncbi:uncharacterized protein E6C27_scaffold82G002360 [Cucumis melo var. makuwa]|uniref:Uncharacterized protein n=1 Tax=Cucumis melo var. makuwa TaxID=1194695 RepID=A0A5A7VBD3_CUCMM|nr:uncharacterized protein E6C27_scaffold82G002360 [Cucumis melo var. makuwa]